jgi:hypothetical protein
MRRRVVRAAPADRGIDRCRAGSSSCAFGFDRVEARRMAPLFALQTPRQQILAAAILPRDCLGESEIIRCG